MNRQPAPFYGRIVQIPMGDEARLGVTEEQDLVDEWEHSRTWKGKPIFFPPSYGKLARVTWSASSPAILEAPAFDRLQQFDRVTLHCIDRKTCFIAAGQASVTTYYPIVPGSGVVASKERSGIRVPVRVVGNTISLQALQDDTVVVRYRPVLEAFVLKFNSGTQSLAGTQTWGISFEQWEPLS